MFVVDSVGFSSIHGLAPRELRSVHYVVPKFLRWLEGLEGLETITT